MNTSILIDYLHYAIEQADNHQKYERAVWFIRGYIAVAKWLEQGCDSSQYSFIVSRGLIRHLKSANECLTDGSGVSSNFDADRIERQVKPLLVKAIEEAEFMSAINAEGIEQFAGNRHIKSMAEKMGAMLD